MDLEFWKQRWVNGDTGWHNAEVNPTLVHHWPELGLAPGATVLVPLCGKTLDMLWLVDQGYRVVGIDVSSVAAVGFFEDQGFPYRERQEGNVRILEWERVKILVGNVFDVLPEQVGAVDAVYDRAATVALPGDVRSRYAEHMARLAGPSVSGLVLTISYPQGEMDGPPFSVPSDEVRSLYGQRYQLTCLSSKDVLADKPIYQERGLSELLNEVHLIAPTETIRD